MPHTTLSHTLPATLMESADCFCVCLSRCVQNTVLYHFIVHYINRKNKRKISPLFSSLASFFSCPFVLPRSTSISWLLHTIITFRKMSHLPALAHKPPPTPPSPINSGNPYDGSILAAHGNVIVITINFRLGVLGKWKKYHFAVIVCRNISWHSHQPHTYTHIRAMVKITATAFEIWYRPWPSPSSSPFHSHINIYIYILV